MTSSLTSGKTLASGLPYDKMPAAKPEWHYWLVACFFGALVGMAAPGLEQWYLPWFGMTALLALSLSARDNYQAGFRGFVFGTAYNLVYLNWLLTFREAYSEGSFTFCPTIINVAFWLLLSSWQGLFVGIFACLARSIPLVPGWLPARHQGRWHLPSFLLLPLLFVSIDRLCNTTQLLGFPWSALHYSQYKQPAILQIASIIGGVGISAWIMLVNTNILALMGAAAKWTNPPNLKSPLVLAGHTAITALLSVLIIAYGAFHLDREKHLQKRQVMVTALQTGLCEKVHGLPTTNILLKYLDLAKASPKNSIVVWPEWSVALSYTGHEDVFQNLSVIPKKYKQSWVLGIFDRKPPDLIYNSVCAISSSGLALPEVYHKRYLVPVGEYTPEWIRDTPIGWILYGLDKKYKDTSSGDKAVVFDVGQARVAPLLCFESFHAKICAQSVRAGGEILADSSNNSWFRLSILSDQMVSFAVMRAVENHRSFVFATALGPSAIIDSSGKILKQAGRELEGTISAPVPVEDDLTPYTRWCF